MRTFLASGLLASIFATSLLACVAPPPSLDDDSSAAAVSRSSGASGLSGRYEPDESASNVVLLDVLVARETPEKAMIQGRLLVTPERTGDSGNYRNACALTMSGILEKPEADGKVEVEVEVRSAEGASKGTISFDARPGLLRSQRLSFALERPPAACTRALAARGDVGKGLVFVKERAAEQGIVGYRTLTADHRFDGRTNPYAAHTPTGNSPSTHAVPSEQLFAGEPVAVIEKGARGFRVAVDRIYERGGIGRTVQSMEVPESKLAEQPRDVEEMSRIAPK